MMNFTVSILFQLGQVLKIVLWISIPLLIVALLITTYLHYRRKRNDTGNDVAAPTADMDLLITGNGTPMPGFSGVHNSREEVALPANQGKQLQQSRAEYAELKKQYHSLEEKYNLLLVDELPDARASAQNMIADLQSRIQSYRRMEDELRGKIESMENGQDDEISRLQAKLKERDNDIQRLQGMISQLNKEVYLHQQQQESQSAEISKMEHLLKELQASAQIALHDSRSLESSWQQKWEEVSKQHYTEKTKLDEQWKDLNDAYRKLQEENLNLQKQAAVSHWQPEANGDAVAVRKQLEALQAEQSIWKQTVEETNYMKDVMEEKKLQIEFLQNQLDQRIKNYHQLENQYHEAEGKLHGLEERITAADNEKQVMRQELENKQAEFDEVKSHFEQQSTAAHEAQATIQSYINEIEVLKRELGNLHSHHEEANQLLSAEKNQVSFLREQLGAEQAKVASLQEKLYSNIDLLKKMYEQVIGIAGDAHIGRPANHEMQSNHML